MGRLPRTLTATLAAAISLVALTGLASAAMRSTKLGPGLCETTGGGRFVDIPGFPGEAIDRRLLTDIRMLERRYSIFITDGYSRDHVHAANGEHPIGLALDIVPDKAAGGRWSDIDRLAKWAEPRQDRPRAPFRWVGYDGDRGHGRGDHLHLSWNHTFAKPGRTARTVYTIRCPGTTAPVPDQPTGGGTGAGAGRGNGGGHPTGGVGTGNGSASGGSGGGTGSGGIGKLRLAPLVIESGGVGFAR